MYTERLKIDLNKMIIKCNLEMNESIGDIEKVKWYENQKYAFESILEIIDGYKELN